LVGLARETLQAPDLNIRMILRPSLTCLAFTSVFITLQTLVDKEGHQKWFHDELSPEGQDTLLPVMCPLLRSPPPCGLPELPVLTRVGQRRTSWGCIHDASCAVHFPVINMNLMMSEVDADRQCWVEQSIVVAA